MSTTSLKPARWVTALALATATYAGAAAAPIPAYPFLHVSGSAYVAAMPDIGALDVEMLALDADPAAGRATLEARVGEVRDLMRRLGLDPEDLQVREVRQSLRKGAGGAGADPAGAPVYELRCDVHINVRNLTVWPQLAGSLFGQPNLDGFAATFDLSTRERLEDELVTQALQDARRRAEVMAAGAGRRLGPLMAATPDAIKNLGTALGLERADFRQARDPGNVRPQADREQLLMIQAIRLRQPVDAVFRLENPAPPARARKKPS
ncbi:SIMPL domain-containing protein [Massilia forsythiae]|uniref:SIMPL domain-containing protein n=1 Tax=Massilia forsythiae TaxID=2728020 RepID=A0A7Z2VYC5_9BURK|nr:SIMPL domain-containing protein [Massilia forsythiae]QJE01696.1 SIMPL domain-containing protein [Massilia forsythiae]